MLIKNISVTVATALAMIMAGPVMAKDHQDKAGDAQAQYSPVGQIDPFTALRSYYDGLHIDLPTAGPSVELDESKALSRIIFGSCSSEHLSQDYWDVMLSQKPDLFLMIGDNVYGDTASTWSADLTSVRESYQKLSESPQFRNFRKKIPMMTGWDDHDYGANDGGGSFAFKEFSETIFEHFWQSPERVRSHPGTYDATMIGPEGQRVQIIILDTRFFRSDLARHPYSRERRPLGNYAQNRDKDATILGETQWQWLAEQLDKPADLRLIFSSIQIETEAHDFESWENFPHERTRFFKLLAQKKADNAILLSGDRHSGGFYRVQPEGLAKPLWELTASSFNLSFRDGDHRDAEPDPLRTGGLWGDPNFGQIDIDWARKNVTLSLRHAVKGTVIEQQSIPAIR